MFRGREMAHTELGRRLLERLANDLVEIAQVDSPARQDGRNMITVFSPRKTQGGAQGRAAGSREGRARQHAISPGDPVPKMKTHRGAARRFRVTKTGKLVRRQSQAEPHAREEDPRPQAPPRPRGPGHRR